MKALFTTLLALVISLAAQAAPLGSAEDEADGWLEDGVYTNRVYSFEVKIPAGWQVVPEDKRQVYTAELNKGTNSDARAFLMLFRPVQSASEIPDIVIVTGAKTGMTAGVSRNLAMGFFHAQKKPKNTDVIRAASPFLLGGLLVAREDAHAAENGHEQYMANMLVAVRDRLISFQCYSASRTRMEESVNDVAAATEFQPDWVARTNSSGTADPPQQRVRLSQETLLSLIEKKVPPEIPDSMAETPVNAAIDMHVLVSSEGNVEKIWVFEGPPQLSWPAVQAVSRWKFRPYVVSGKPVPVESTLTVTFQ
jgi:Gram-negative bacterial TonB protein C-terminal